jgi:hypothetical protein
MSVTVRRTLLLALGASLVTACVAATGAAGPPPAVPPGGILLAAEGLSFDRQRLDVPAGRPFPLLLQNRETAPHNVTVLDVATGRTVFVGETFSGPDVRTYDMPAIPAGTYGFRCDVHPEMSGTLFAAPRVAG